MINIGSRPPAIAKANKRMNRFTLIAFGVMFAYGILLPANWKVRFGIFGSLIEWASLAAPATVKVTQLSPIPELVSGFFGLGSWAVVTLALMLARKDPLGERVRFAFSRPGWSFLKTFGFIYLIGIPACALGLWVAFFMPITVDMTGGFTWGGKLLVSMITDRFALSFFGALAVAGLGVILFMPIVFIIGPISLIFSRK